MTDLSATATSISGVLLKWTAPGNDGNSGTAASYEIRYSTSAITGGNWPAATPVPGPPAPLPAGSVQTVSVTGLLRNTPYFFALKTSDSVPNVSPLSNVATASTQRANIAYLADANVVGKGELFVAADDGSYVANVSSATPGSPPVQAAFNHWSPDGSKLAFVATTSGVNDLFVVSSSGGAVTKVSGPMVAGGSVFSFQWAGDGLRLFYSADEETDGVRELYSVRPDGSGHVKVSGPMAPGSVGVLNFDAAPDGSRVAYEAYQDSGTVPELYTTLADGTGNVKVSATPVIGGPGSYLWAPDSSRIAYTMDQGTKLFTARPGGSAIVQVSPVGAPGHVKQLTPAFSSNWAPDSSRIAYVADEDTPGVQELYSVRPDGTGFVKVSGSLVAGGGVTQFNWPWNSASRIAYTADQDTQGRVELYTSLPGGGGNVKISAPVVAGGQVHAPSSQSGSFFWAWDGSRIAYRADGTTVGVREVYSALPDSAASTLKISAPLLAGEVTEFFWSPDSARVAYRAQQDTAGVYDAYTSLAAGGGNVRISPVIPSGSGVSPSIRIVASANKLIFRAALSGTSPLELFTAAPDGSSTVKVSGPLTAGGSVQISQAR